MGGKLFPGSTPVTLSEANKLYKKVLAILKKSNLFDQTKIYPLGSSRLQIQNLPGAKQESGDMDLLAVGLKGFATAIIDFMAFLDQKKIIHRKVSNNLVSIFLDNKQVDIMIVDPNDKAIQYSKDLYYYAEPSKFKQQFKTELLRMIVSAFGYSFSPQGIIAFKLDKDINYDDLKTQAKKYNFEVPDTLKQFEDEYLTSKGYLKSRLDLHKKIIEAFFVKEYLTENEWPKIFSEIFSIPISQVKNLGNFEGIIDFLDYLWTKKIVSTELLTKILENFVKTIKEPEIINYLKSRFPILENMINEAITGMPSIKHLGLMEAAELIEFLENFFKAGNTIEISVKIDGMNVSFGVNEQDKLYTKTKKGAPVYDPNEYVIDYLNGFKKFHLELMSRNCKEVIKFLENEYDVKGVQIFGELLPSAQTNVVQYNNELIGDGAVVIFDVRLEGKSLITSSDIGHEFINALAGIMNESGTTWKFYSKFLVNKPSEGFNVELFYDLKNFYEVHKYILKSRKHADREVKAWAISILEELKDKISIDLLSNIKVISPLGEDQIEGLVLRDLESGALIKLVNFEFQIAREDAWGLTNEISKLLKKYGKEVIKTVFNNADVLRNFKKAKEKIVDYYWSEKQKNPKFKFSSQEEYLKVIFDDMTSEVKLPSAKIMIKNFEELTLSCKKEITSLLEDFTKDTVEKDKKFELTINAFQNTIKTLDNILDNLKTLKTKSKEVAILNLIVLTWGEYKLKRMEKELNLFEEKNNILSEKIKIGEGSEIFDYIESLIKKDKLFKAKLTLALVNMLNLKSFGGGTAGEVGEAVLVDLFRGLPKFNDVVHTGNAPSEIPEELNKKTDFYVVYNKIYYPFSMKVTSGENNAIQLKKGTGPTFNDLYQELKVYLPDIKEKIDSQDYTTSRDSAGEFYVIALPFKKNQQKILSTLESHVSAGLEIIHISPEKITSKVQNLSLTLTAARPAEINLDTVRFSIKKTTPIFKSAETLHKVEFLSRNTAMLRLRTDRSELWAHSSSFSKIRTIKLEARVEDLDKEAKKHLSKSLLNVLYLNKEERDLLTQFIEILNLTKGLEDPSDELKDIKSFIEAKRLYLE